jgi:glycosyltransferase involved in cell wall biosynthesis
VATNVGETNGSRSQAHSPAKRIGMRVCMVSYSFYEGDNRVMRYAETLAKRGDEVEVIALRRRGQQCSENMNGVRVRRIQDRTINEKSRFSYLFRTALFFFRSMCAVSLSHLRKRYSLVHVHSVPDFLVFSAWLPRLTGARIVLDIHDLLPELYAIKFGSGAGSLIFRILQSVERVSAAFADHVIAANHIWHQKLILRSMPAWKCSVLLNFPDRSIFRPRGQGRRDGKFVFLYPGTLSWHQGLDIAIRAFAKIKDEFPQAEFQIYGEGSRKQSLMALARDLGLQGRVLFHASVSLREIAGIIEKADLGVVAKRKDSFGNEAFSTKILEFMAVGVPVVVSDTAIDRYYFSERTVTFFRSGDPDDLARCMRELIRDPEARQRQIRNATEFVGQNDWDSKKDEYLKLVDSLVSNSRQSDMEARRNHEAASVQLPDRGLPQLNSDISRSRARQPEISDK